MSVRLFGCRKFGRLLSERADRSLTAREEMFMTRHEAVCPACLREDALEGSALNMLRAAAVDAAPTPQFDERVMRKLHVQRVRDGLGYWTPALIGCAVACFAFLVALRMLSERPTAKTANVPNGQARRDTTSYPRLKLAHVPHLDR